MAGDMEADNKSELPDATPARSIGPVGSPAGQGKNQDEQQERDDFKYEMYANGQGVPQNAAEAARWSRLAADQGNAGAQSNLGNMYRTGRSVPQSDAEAVRWYRLAADQGLAEAQSNLGAMYGEGRGVPKNFIEAYKWWNLAAAQGQSVATKNRDIVRRMMTPAQIAEGQRLSAEWKPK